MTWSSPSVTWADSATQWGGVFGLGAVVLPLAQSGEGHALDGGAEIFEGFSTTDAPNVAATGAAATAGVPLIGAPSLGIATIAPFVYARGQSATSLPADAASEIFQGVDPSPGPALTAGSVATEQIAHHSASRIAGAD